MEGRYLFAVSVPTSATIHGAGQRPEESFTEKSQMKIPNGCVGERT